MSSDKVQGLIQKIGEQFAQALRDGIANPDGWVAPWHAHAGAYPTNALTGRPYRGTNPVWLLMNGGGQWATYKQWQELGGQVRKGEKGTRILVPMVIKERDGNETGSTWVAFRTATVFHSGQQDGWAVPEAPAPAAGDDEAPAFDAWQAEVIARMGVTYTEADQGAAYYRPGADSITLPLPSLFKTAAGRRSTFAHEYGHATGHASRLARPAITESAPFGSDAHAREELVAELTSAAVGMALGVATELRDDHRDYLALWQRMVTDDPHALVEAMGAAQKAADCLLAYAAGDEAAA